MRAQALGEAAKSFFIAPVPAPLALLRGFNQTSFGQDCHVMRDSWLRKLHAFFNVTGAQTGFS